MSMMYTSTSSSASHVPQDKGKHWRTQVNNTCCCYCSSFYRCSCCCCFTAVRSTNKRRRWAETMPILYQRPPSRPSYIISACSRPPACSRTHASITFNISVFNNCWVLPLARLLRRPAAKHLLNNYIKLLHTIAHQHLNFAWCWLLPVSIQSSSFHYPFIRIRADTRTQLVHNCCSAQIQSSTLIWYLIILFQFLK